VSHASAVRRLITTLNTRFREGSSALEPHAFSYWRRWTAGGLVCLIALTVLLVWIGKRLQATGALAWEPEFLRTLGRDGPFSFSTAVWWQTFGTDITLVILILLTTGIAIWARRPITACSIVVAFLVVDPIVRLGWMLWDRSRPDVLYEGLAAPAFHSFPSGHTAKTLAVYGILTFIWIRASRSILERIVAVLMIGAIAVAVPLGRLAMGVHWPSDILAGWIIGLFWLVVLAAGLRFEKRREL
jgi:undecaprenyl-diphosphatase